MVTGSQVAAAALEEDHGHIRTVNTLKGPAQDAGVIGGGVFQGVELRGMGGVVHHDARRLAICHKPDGLQLGVLGAFLHQAAGVLGAAGLHHAFAVVHDIAAVVNALVLVAAAVGHGHILQILPSCDAGFGSLVANFFKVGQVTGGEEGRDAGPGGGAGVGVGGGDQHMGSGNAGGGLYLPADISCIAFHEPGHIAADPDEAVLSCTDGPGAAAQRGVERGFGLQVIDEGAAHAEIKLAVETDLCKACFHGGSSFPDIR